jgi:cardiolipin synthase
VPHRTVAIAPLPPWETEQLFFNAENWFASILQAVNQAQFSIECQTYIFEMDSVGRPLLDALCEAAERGVVVRLIVDGIGSSAAIDELLNRLKTAGGELHIYNPLPWSWAVSRLERSDWLTRFITRLGNLNNRQHCKLCLVDRHIAWVGSFNITAQHLVQPLGRSSWKDAGVQVTGKRTLLLREFFDAVWFNDIEKMSSHFLFHPLTNFSPALRKRRLRVLLQEINHAQRRLWISSAYFSPVPILVRGLKKAAMRGVDVRIIVSQRSDVAFFPALASTYYADLLKVGIRIFEYRSGILHTKHWLLDNRVMVGSSNMNHRSVLHDVELDVEVFSPAVLQAMEADFDSCFASSKEMTLKNVNRFSLWFVIRGHIPRLLRYWL